MTPFHEIFRQIRSKSSSSIQFQFDENFEEIALSMLRFDELFLSFLTKLFSYSNKGVIINHETLEMLHKPLGSCGNPVWKL